MKGLSIRLFSEEPLIISNGSAEGSTHKCLDYIPGNMLLGALAALWKKKNSTIDPDTSDEFYALFVENKVSFGHALPVCNENASYATPKSFYHTKSHKGLPSINIAEDKDSQVYNLIQYQDADFSDLKQLATPFIDFETKHVPDIKHIYVTHITLDAKNRRVANHKLFGFDALANGITFQTTVICDDKYVDVLKNLLAPDTAIQLGHCRSSGYGTTRVVEIKPCNIQEEIKVDKGEHTLYFESAFFPLYSWQTPYDGLVSLLQEKLGDITIDQNKVFTDAIRIEGFNSLWKLPRASRVGIAAGSVITFTTSKASTLPCYLGSWQQEGYGRIRLDLDILQQKTIVPEVIKLKSQTEVKQAKNISLPLLTVWRKRSAMRIASSQAVDFIWHSSLFEKLFAALKTMNKPSQNQRGNIRRMVMSQSRDTWVQSFATMLTKQPGRQWKTVRVPNPFANYQQRGNLDEVMLKLLDLEQLESWLKSADKEGLFSLPKLAGNELTPAEANEFRSERHKRLLLELLRRWEKEFRSQEG